MAIGFAVGLNQLRPLANVPGGFEQTEVSLQNPADQLGVPRLQQRDGGPDY